MVSYLTARTRPMRGVHPALRLLSENGYADAGAAVAHLTASPHPSFIGIRPPGQGVTPLISIVPLPGSGSGALAAVAELDTIDPSRTRVVDTFRAKFPRTVLALSRVDAYAPRAAHLKWLLRMSAALIDLDERSFRRDHNDSGLIVRIDTPIIQHGTTLALDSRRLLRSLISYRNAGVAAPTLAASVFSALGAFAADAVRRVAWADPDIEVLACAGDLFTDNLLLRERARRALTRTRHRVLLA